MFRIGKRARWLRHLLAVATSVTMFAAALWVLHRELAGIQIADVLAAVGALEPRQILFAVALTAASYLALTGFDVLALRHLRCSLPYRRVALTSFVATVVGHNLGAAVLSAGAVRLRMYTASGLAALDVAAVIALVAVTAAVGMTFVAGATLALVPAQAGALLHVPPVLARGLGLAALALLCGYLLFCVLCRRPVRIGPWCLRLPGARTTLGQILVATMDVVCAAGTLYVLLPADPALSFPLFLSVYVLAIVAGTLSNVPGGLGVFESVLLLALPGQPKDTLLAGILIYRVIYYLVPLGIALVAAAAHELSFYRRHIARGLAWTRDALAGVAPQVMAAATFLAGAVLLFSGALPVSGDRTALLSAWLPLVVLELSHLSGSLLGLGLMVLAAALYRRVTVASRLVLVLLIGAAVVSLLKGLAWEQALLCTVAALLLWMGRGAFYRRASLVDVRFGPDWALAVWLVLGGSIWIGLFAFKHVEYADELWWQFAFDADAPRFLRATLAAVVAATLLASLRLLRPAAPPPDLPQEPELERAARIVARTPAADAALVLLGDKRILFADDDAGFLMFQIRGQSWVVAGDPVGPMAVADTLAWRFRTLCDRYGGRPVFTHADAEHLPLYLDLGLVPLKLGEEAVVELPGFSLEGSARAKLRNAQRKVEKAGVQFEVIEPAGLTDALMAELAAVSDSWLEAKSAREKGFSLGRFEPAYIRRFNCALARRDGQVLAFANLWCGAGRTELAVDLMRYRPDAPNGVMDYLFVEVMRWGAAAGYRRFNLGMAPLSGLESGPLAPLWHRIGTLIFQQGEHFYNFAGLRAYKEKFHPQWHPRYLVLPSGLALPAVLLDISALVSGGVRGVVTR